MTESEAEELETSPSTELVTIIKDARLEPDLAKEFTINFEEHFKMANEWSKKAKNIIVTNENQTVLMEQARVARLFIRSKRLEIENFRKSKKEYYLRGGQAVDKVCTFLKNMIEPIENHLDLQEHYIEYKKKAEDARLLAEAQAKMEADRMAKEAADAESLAKAQAENARLQKEADAKEKALAEERRKVAYEQEKIKKENEAKIAEENRKRQEELARVQAENKVKLDKERADREKVEAELRAKKQAELKAEADKIREQERLLKAEDGEKLLILRKQLIDIKIPKFKSVYNQRIADDIKSYVCLAILKIKTDVNEEEE